MLRMERHRRFGQIRAVETGLAVDVFGRGRAGASAGRTGARMDRDVGPVRQFDDAARIHLGQAQGHVTRHRHDAEHVELGRRQGQEDRDRVVLAGVGIDDDLCAPYGLGSGDGLSVSAAARAMLKATTRSGSIERRPTERDV